MVYTPLPARERRGVREREQVTHTRTHTHGHIHTRLLVHTLHLTYTRSLQGGLVTLTLLFRRRGEIKRRK